MVNVTKENFIEQSNDFLHHLPNASFIAIDEEMTGISVAPSTTISTSSSSTQGNKTTHIKPPQRNNSKDLTPAQRYSELKLAPEKYSIIQLGIALYFYHDNEDLDANATATANSPIDSQQRPYDTHPHFASGSSGEVTQLPSSPLRSSSSSTSGTRRGYTISTPNANSHLPVTPKVVSMYDVKTHIPPGTTYSVRRYNFYMFPDATTTGAIQQIPRDVVMNVSTIAFLLQHNMSFDLWTRYGIPYATSCSQAQSYIKSYIEQECRLRREELGKIQQQQQSSVTIQSTVQNRVVLRRVEDIAFHARTMATLRDWLDSPVTQSSSVSQFNVASTQCHEYDAVDPYLDHSLLLPSCNSFLRRALYESIDTEYPALVLERNHNRSGGNGGQQQIRVFRLNAEENERRKHYLQQQRYYHFIMNQIGIYRIFAALRLVCNGHAIDYKHVLFAKSYDDIDWDVIFNTTGCDSPYDFANVFDVDDVTNIIGLELAPDPHSVVPHDRTLRAPIPLVVHNGFMDLCFLMTHFVSHPLPNEYQECKQMIHKLFPFIYDTKILATECPCWDENDQHSVNTNLSNLFNMIGRSPNYYYNHQEDLDQENSRTLLDDIYVEPAFATKKVSASSDRSVVVNVDDQEHEAAYDAYMTGAIFVGLCQRIHSRKSSSISRLVHTNNAAIPLMIHLDVNRHADLRAYYGLNKLYQMSIYTMDLEEARYNRDPMSRGLVAKYTYRISNIDPAITTRDIVTALSGLQDKQNRPVNFLIIWIDDTTFLVAASYSPPLIQPDVTTLQHQQPVVVNDEPEEGEEVEEIEEVVADVDTITDANPIENTHATNDVDAILREHGDEIWKALRERFHNSETTIIVLQEYLDAQAIEENDYDAKHESGLAKGQSNSWMNRMWSVVGWPFMFNTTTTTNKKHTSDEHIETSTTNKRQRLH